MGVVKHLAAIYLLLVAAAVAAHFLVAQFYDPMLEDTALTVWRILDPFDGGRRCDGADSRLLPKAET